MSYENVKKYFESVGLEDHITVRSEIGDTVEHAAAAIGCEPARIAKTMSFLLDDGPIVVAMAGDAKVNSSKFKATFHQKATMVPWEQVDELIGHEPGSVCPFALKDGVRVYLDISLKRFEYIHAAGGNDHTTVRLTMEELIEYSHMEDWVDVCKGWIANE